MPSPFNHQTPTPYPRGPTFLALCPSYLHSEIPAGSLEGLFFANYDFSMNHPRSGLPKSCSHHPLQILVEIKPPNVQLLHCALGTGIPSGCSLVLCRQRSNSSLALWKNDALKKLRLKSLDQTISCSNSAAPSSVTLIFHAVPFCQRSQLASCRSPRVNWLVNLRRVEDSPRCSG